jgi:hypothetical protein
MQAIIPTHSALSFMNSLFIFILGITYANAQDNIKNEVEVNKTETEIQSDIYWNVKAYRPNAELLNIKAIDKDGKMHDVKAIQTSDDTSILDVKALKDGQRLPIKLIVKDMDRYYPAKGIDTDGTLIDIKAVTKDGEILAVKGVSKSGNIVHLRAITKDSLFYNIISISPEGKVNNVKGMKMLDTRVETVINGVSVFAHVKSLKQD